MEGDVTGYEEMHHMAQALGFLVHPLRMAIKHAIPAVVDEARAHVLHQQATIVEWRAARKPPLPPPVLETDYMPERDGPGRVRRGRRHKGK